MGGCTSRIISTLFALVVVVAVLLAATYYFLMPRLDTMIEDAVRREFILPPSSTVDIERGSLFDTLEGQVRRFYVNSAEAKIDGVLVNDLRFVAKGIAFDLGKTILTGKADLKDVAFGELELKISEASIEERWAAELERKGLSKVEVTLQNNRVGISGLVDLKLAKLRVAAKGKLVVDGTDKIKFKPAELDLGGTNIEVGGIRAAVNSLTPVVDLGQFKMTILVDKLEAKDGYLLVSARSSDLNERMNESAEARSDEKARLAHEREVLEKQLADVKKQQEEADKAGQQQGQDKGQPGK
jgi:hypothetical protein